jgi:uncharacterized RDD family membrane protein YckC
VNDIAPGWYTDPVDQAVQRYWDGEGWTGEPIPAGQPAPPGPPPSGASQARKEAPAAATESPAPGQPTPLAVLPSGLVVRPEPGSPASRLPPGWPAYPYVLVPQAPQPHGHALARFGPRLLARFIDFLAILGLNAMVNGWFIYKWWQVNTPFWQEFSRRFAAGQSTAGLEAPPQGSTLLIVILVLATALWFAYEVPAHAGTGQTVGKRLAHLKVMRLESSEPLGLRRSMRRWNTLGLPTLLWTCFGLGFLLQFLDCLWVAIDRPLHQALHDKSAATVVVDIGQSGSSQEGSA